MAIDHDQLHTPQKDHGPGNPFTGDAQGTYKLPEPAPDWMKKVPDPTANPAKEDR